MIHTTHRSVRLALLAAGLTSSLGSCQFDVTGVPVEQRPPGDGAIRAEDATVRADDRGSWEQDTEAGWPMGPRGGADAGLLDGRVVTGIGVRRDGATTFTPRSDGAIEASREGAIEAGVGPGEAREGGASEAGPPVDAPQPTCPVAPQGEPSAPYALRVNELARPSEPAFKGRPLASVAKNGAHRLWVFRHVYYQQDTRQTSAKTLPLSAYDTASVDDLTLPTRVPLTFTVADVPLVERRADELGELQMVQTVSFEPLSLVPHAEAQRGSKLFVLKRDLLESAGVWLAEVAPESVRAQRQPTALFAADMGDYVHAAFRGEQYLTVYACDNPAATCTVARAPNGSEDRPEAYEVRTRDASGGWSWTREFSAATPVISGVHADLTVSYNRYLQKYLAVHLEAQDFEQTIVLQTATAPEGPWTPYASAHVTGAPLSFIRHAREQPALGDPCGKRVALSYFEPDALEGIFPAGGVSVVSYVELP